MCNGLFEDLKDRSLLEGIPVFFDKKVRFRFRKKRIIIFTQKLLTVIAQKLLARAVETNESQFLGVLDKDHIGNVLNDRI